MGETKTVDFRHFGDVLKINTKLLSLSLDNGYLPIVSSLGADNEGQVFNINADTIAAETSIQLNAETGTMIVAE